MTAAEADSVSSTWKENETIFKKKIRVLIVDRLRKWSLLFGEPRDAAPVVVSVPISK